LTSLHELAARERDRVRNWYCSSCHVEERTQGPGFLRHKCHAHNGLDLPMVEEGRNSVHIIREREDYLGKDISDARDASGKVIMSAYTEFDDGSHETTVFIPCAIVENNTHGLVD
jgi:hypothetical protein